MNLNYNDIIDFVRDLYKVEVGCNILLHHPTFLGREKKYVFDCIDSTYVSSVGMYVEQFEKMVAKYTGSKYAIATSSGTSALHLALKLVGVSADSEVITQPLSFIAGCNAISYCGAKPIFVDVDIDTMGLSPKSLFTFLSENSIQESGRCINKKSRREIKAALPMHTFGLPCRIQQINEICEEFGIPVIEDAAESLGSFYGGKHTGTYGKIGIFSFNGNKIITTGGGGALVTDNFELASRAKHISTTAKVLHPYEFIHDEVGYNYRMPNINAALGCAQMELINELVDSKRENSDAYQTFFSKSNFKYVKELRDARSNYWLNAIVCDTAETKNKLIKKMNEAGIMCRPIWRLSNKLKMYEDCQHGDLSNAIYLEDRVVNLPSSSRLK